MKTILVTIIGALVLGITLLFLDLQTTVANVINQTHISAITKGEQPVSLLAVGDIMLGRNVETLMRQHGDSYPFEHISAFLKEFDMVFGNLEGPIARDHRQTPDYSLKFSFQPKTASLLGQNNIELVSLANNHALDQGKTGYQDTGSFLLQQNIAFMGHPAAIDTRSVVEKEIQQKKLVFVGLNTTWPSFSLSQAAQLVLETASNPHDLLIVFMHWGDEYAPKANERQQEIAHALIDSGADIILGAHPHVAQNIELYNNKLIFYSLGNFIFDQYFSNDVQKGLAVGIKTDSRTLAFSLYPLKSAWSQPQLMDEKEKLAWLSALARKSSPELFDAIKSGSIVMTK